MTPFLGSRRAGLLLGLLCALTASCKERRADRGGADASGGVAAAAATGAAGASGGQATVAPSSGAAKLQSARQGSHVVRSLLSEVWRAELRSRGLFIDLGTPDQYKYLYRHRTSGWGSSRDERGESFVEVGHDSRLLFHEERQRISRLLVRARAPKANEKLCGLIDERPLFCIDLGTSWRVHSCPIEPALAPGRHALTLHAKRPVHVDWLWLQEGTGKGRERARGQERARGERERAHGQRREQGRVQEPEQELEQKLALELGERRQVLDFGAPRRALVATPPRTYSFYLQMPPGGRLVFDHGAQQPTRFSVDVFRDGRPPSRLFSRVSRGARWQEVSVSLGQLANQVVRLELSTELTEDGRASGGAGRASQAGLAGWGEPVLVQPGPAPAIPSIPAEKRPKNIIHIVLDAVRTDVLRAFNPEAPLETPALDRLAERSVLFRNAYASSGWTVPSVGSTLSGRYPLGLIGLSGVPEQIKLLPEHLQANGFRTACFSANPHFHKELGLGRGWGRLEVFRGSRPLYPKALGWLKANKDAPFYLYIHNMDGHGPYKAWSQYEKKYLDGTYKGRLPRVISGKLLRALIDGKIAASEEDIRYIRSMYYGALHHHDIELGRFLDGLRQLGVSDETLIVVSADHGQELFEHGRLGHGRTAYEEVIRVPLLIHYPALFPKKVAIDEVVELVDLAPTQLELLGLPPMAAIHGTSLLGTIYGRPRAEMSYALAGEIEVAVRAGPVKLIRSWRNPEKERERLFILADDPQEQRDRSRQHPILMRFAEVHLGEGFSVLDKKRRLSGLADGPPREVEGRSAILDPELKKRLRALGYLP